jgi:hypothetical protein
LPGLDWEGVGEREFPVSEGSERSERWKTEGFQSAWWLKNYAPASLDAVQGGFTLYLEDIQQAESVMTIVRLYVGSAHRGGPLFEAGSAVASLANSEVFDRFIFQPDGAAEMLYLVWKKWSQHNVETGQVEECRLVIPEYIWETFTKH